jgi:hypothetical protein
VLAPLAPLCSAHRDSTEQTKQPTDSNFANILTQQFCCWSALAAGYSGHVGHRPAQRSRRTGGCDCVGSQGHLATAGTAMDSPDCTATSAGGTPCLPVCYNIQVTMTLIRCCQQTAQLRLNWFETYVNTYLVYHTRGGARAGWGPGACGLHTSEVGPNPAVVLRDRLRRFL